MGWDDGAEIANVLQSNQRMDCTDMLDTRIQETPGSRLATREIERQFLVALRMFHFGAGSLAADEIANLTRWWSEGLGGLANVKPPEVPALLSDCMCKEIETAWERGWQPADITRLANRRLSTNHGLLAAHLIAVQAESYRSRRRTLPSWIDQLDQIGAIVQWLPSEDHLSLFARANGLDLEGILRTALELVAMIHHLPKIPLLDPPPSEWDKSAAIDAALSWRKRERDGELRHLERVRALLAKAESTPFEEEADAFTEKAQELMTRYSIDAALLAAHAAGKLTESPPRGVRIGIDDPYSQAKATLLSTIADASGCRAVWSKDFSFSTVFGFEGELKSVELLYTSLLLQARRAMARAGEAGSHARSRAFRQSFLAGFADRIGHRLMESVSTIISDVSEEQGVALVPVLAARSQVVDDHRNDVFPELGSYGLSVGDWSGWVSGSAAADVAEIARGPLLDNRANRDGKQTA